MLFTIGYENKIIEDFISLLKDNKVSKVVDVRELPLSRKKGYSKSTFSEILEENDISYIHMKELGSPRNLRKELRDGGDINLFFEGYKKHLKTKQDTINELYEIISEEDCCLVCYEDLPIGCHRREICIEIKNIDNNGLKIKHL